MGAAMKACSSHHPTVLAEGMASQYLRSEGAPGCGLDGPLEIPDVDRLMCGTASEVAVGSMEGPGAVDKRGALAAAWDGLSIDRRRDIIAEALGPITIAPAGRGQRFNPKRIRYAEARRPESTGTPRTPGSLG
jgi:hypothetical protein